MLLEVQNLVKRFPKVTAVDGVSFSIAEGRCFGLLGPNGAGKSTTIEMMEGIKEPTSGSILFRGKPIGPEFKERSGIQFQATTLQDYLTVREVLEMFTQLFDRARDPAELIKKCALGEFLDQDAQTLSGGQQQRLLLAVALVNDPDVVFLDEPTTGLDPQARRNFWDMVEGIKKEGKTIVLTTHYMEEAYTLCDEIAIMDHGKIIAQGVPDQLLHEHFDGVAVDLPSEAYPGPLDQLPFKAFRKQGVIEIPTRSVNEVLDFFLRAGTDLSGLRVRPRTLEDLFLQLTGKDLRA